MKRRIVASVCAVALVAIITACTSTPTFAPPSPPAAATPAPTAEATELTSVTTVRFTSNRASVDVTIDEETPAVRDFLSMLPLELTLEEFNGREKIAYLPRELETAGSPGSDPEDGDLIYYRPWGNLGFYYNTTGIGPSDSTPHLGTFDASDEQLALLEGVVTIQIVG